MEGNYFWKPIVPLITSRTLAGKTQKSDLRSVEHERRSEALSVFSGESELLHTSHSEDTKQKAVNTMAGVKYTIYKKWIHTQSVVQ